MASIQRAIRRSMVEIIQSKGATTSQRLETCKVLLKTLASSTKGKLAAEHHVSLISILIDVTPFVPGLVPRLPDSFLT